MTRALSASWLRRKFLLPPVLLTTKIGLPSINTSAWVGAVGPGTVCRGTREESHLAVRPVTGKQTGFGLRDPQELVTWPQTLSDSREKLQGADWGRLAQRRKPSYKFRLPEERFGHFAGSLCIGLWTPPEKPIFPVRPPELHDRAEGRDQERGGQ